MLQGAYAISGIVEPTGCAGIGFEFGPACRVYADWGLPSRLFRTGILGNHGFRSITGSGFGALALWQRFVGNRVNLDPGVDHDLRPDGRTSWTTIRKVSRVNPVEGPEITWIIQPNSDFYHIFERAIG